MDSRTGRRMFQIPGTHGASAARWLLVAVVAMSTLSAGKTARCQEESLEELMDRIERRNPAYKWSPAFSLRVKDSRRQSLVSLQMSRDGKILAALHGVVHVFDVEKKKLLLKTPKDQGGVFALSPDGRRIAMAPGHRISVFKWSDLIEGKTIEQAGIHLERTPAIVDGLTFSPDGRHVAGGYGNLIWIWDARSGRVVKKLMAEPKGIFNEWIVLRYSRDGKYLAASCVSGHVGLFDGKTYKQLRDLRGRDSFASVDFTPDGRLLAGGGHFGKTGVFQYLGVEIWDTASGKPVPDDNAFNPGQRITQRAHHLMVSFSTDGKLLATGGMEKVIVWSVEKQEAMFHLPHPNANPKHVPVLFSPDGKWLVTATRATIHFWDVAPMVKLLPRKKK